MYTFEMLNGITRSWQTYTKWQIRVNIMRWQMWHHWGNNLLNRWNKWSTKSRFDNVLVIGNVKVNGDDIVKKDGEVQGNYVYKDIEIIKFFKINSKWWYVAMREISNETLQRWKHVTYLCQNREAETNGSVTSQPTTLISFCGFSLLWNSAPFLSGSCSRLWYFAPFSSVAFLYCGISLFLSLSLYIYIH